MTEPLDSPSRSGTGSNRIVALTLVGLVAGMVGASYAAVPLYRIFCQATGYGGTPKRVENAFVTPTTIPTEVRFDANVSGGLPWKFEPIDNKITVNIGDLTTVRYRVTNLSDHETSGTASYNVMPDLVASYFSKIQCFCFTSQKLGPHQSEELAVTFYVDPAMLKDDEVKDVRSITLSYSFYPTQNEVDGAASVADLKSKGSPLKVAN